MNYIYFHTGTTSGEYPVSEAEIRALHPNTSFPAVFSPPEGYQPVFPVPVPAHDPATHVAIEVAPTLTTKGFYEQTWEIRDLDPEIAAANLAARKAERVAALVAEVDRIRDAKIASDFVYDFGTTPALDDLGNQIEAGVRLLQMRDKDRAFWENLRGTALTAVLNNQGSAIMYMRAEDNWNIQTTASQVLTVLTATSVRGAQLVAFAGALKTQIRTAEDPDAVTINDGWPG
jgi:hypothetical protein